MTIKYLLKYHHVISVLPSVHFYVILCKDLSVFCLIPFGREKNRKNGRGLETRRKNERILEEWDNLLFVILTYNNCCLASPPPATRLIHNLFKKKKH